MTDALTQLLEWQELQRHRDQLKATPLAEIVSGDVTRLENCALAFEGLRLNYALDHVTAETMTLLTKLAAARRVEDWRARMWQGEAINVSENRAALHVALRQSGDAPLTVGGANVMPEIRTAQRRIADFVAGVREGRTTGATGKRIRHVVNIGIGGSDLGPRMALLALATFVSEVEVHCVANADAFELTELFKKLDPAETLFLVVSKTFATQETLLNAHTAREWLVGKLGEQAVAKHFAAVSINDEAAKTFGILPDNIFPIWDWVGGRFSLWSAVGLSLALAIGNANFAQLLRGAEAMDRHFRTAPLAMNMPVMLAMLGVWSRNFLGCAAHAILPYSERLRELPRYLQQLEMESNGKAVTRDGQAIDVKTASVVFGEPGTVGQHGFHQWLHQGSDIVAADFIGVTEDDLGKPKHHEALLSNMAAQATALVFGQADGSYAGNRGSTIITLKRLDPYHLGLLLALYEHKVFVESVIWGNNPFDQPGVELGKRMAKALAAKTAPVDKAGQFLARLYATIVK